MSRRSFVIAVTSLVFLACGLAASLFLMVRYEPRTYLQAAVPPGANRQQLARDFTHQFFQLVNAFSDDREERDGGVFPPGNGSSEERDNQPWGIRFTSQQINSYFAESFVKSGLETQLADNHISQPRVIIEPERVRLAFRYGTGVLSSIISIDLRVWLAKGEANAVALQLIGFHAGALPISAQSLLERISQVARDSYNLNIDWYRDEGYPVALIHFQQRQSRTTLILQGIQLEEGAITIHGRSNDPASVQTMLQLPATTSLKPPVE
jgi:hypothetical protein